MHGGAQCVSEGKVAWKGGKNNADVGLLLLAEGIA